VDAAIAAAAKAGNIKPSAFTFIVLTMHTFYKKSDCKSNPRLLFTLLSQIVSDYIRLFSQDGHKTGNYQVSFCKGLV
jgi:hypothetical protein